MKWNAIICARITVIIFHFYSHLIWYQSLSFCFAESVNWKFSKQNSHLVVFSKFAAHNFTFPNLLWWNLRHSALLIEPLNLIFRVTQKSETNLIIFKGFTVCFFYGNLLFYEVKTRKELLGCVLSEVRRTSFRKRDQKHIILKVLC